MPREQTVDFADSSRLKPQFPSELTEDGSLPPRLLSSELGFYSHGFLANLPGRARATFFPGSGPSGRYRLGPGLPGSEPPRLCPAILASVRAPWAVAGGWRPNSDPARGRARPAPSSPLPGHPQGPLTLHHLLGLLLPRAALRRHIGCSFPFRNLSPQAMGQSGLQVQSASQWNKV